MTRKEGVKNLSVTMTEVDLHAVHQLAREREFKVTADYIRSLIEKDAKALGKPITFEVDRGGYRGVKSLGD